MDDDLKELKQELKSIVVSSPTQLDVRTLMRDYRSMVGKPLPLAKYGYKDPVQFLKERCNDCFVVQEKALNPVLTLIVPETLKHIDKFVQNQRVPSTKKNKAKRRSISAAKPPPPQNLIFETFAPKQKQITTKNVQPPKGDICSISSLKINEEKTCDVKEPNNDQPSHNGMYSKTALEKFLKKRSALYNSSQYLESEANHNEKEYFKEDTDSGRQTNSSNGSEKFIQLEELKMEIRNLVEEHTEGVWFTDLIPFYRERYGRELNFSRFGYTCVLSLASVLEDVLTVWRPEGAADWKLLPLSVHLPPSAHSLPPLVPLKTAQPSLKSRNTVDPDDALPGISFDPDVFPADCMHYLESIPHAKLPEEANVEVQVGELYSPSHFWLMRLGDAHHIALENVMDDMNEYFKRGEGKERRLAVGAVRVGHYCSSCYEGDWHRSLIVRVLDSDTVKVRHVDYGTVDRQAVSELRPLLRRWSTLPQQAIRACLAGVRPPAAGRRWPRTSAAHLLRQLTDKRLIAQIVNISKDEVLEVFLIDTSTDEDVCINMELVRSGHADSRPDSCLGTSECYLYPTFTALESGDTPNYAELHSYLRYGINPEYVEEFRRHVPSCLPSPPTSSDYLMSPPLNCTSLEYPTTSNHSPSLLEYPDSSSLLTNRVPIFPSNQNTQSSTDQDPTNQIPTYPTTTLSFPALSAPVCQSQHTSTHTNEPNPTVTQPQHGVTLSASDCEFFTLLSRVDPSAAQRFMMEAIQRGSKPPSSSKPLNPEAKEFCMVAAQTQTEPPVHAPTSESQNSNSEPLPNSTQINRLHPAYNIPQPNVSINGYTPRPAIRAQTKHFNPIKALHLVNNPTSNAHGARVALRPQQQNLRLPPGFESNKI